MLTSIEASKNLKMSKQTKNVFKDVPCHKKEKDMQQTEIVNNLTIIHCSL